MRPIEGARRGKQRVGEFLRIGLVADQRPVDDRLLLGFARPFDEGDGDGAMRARADRLQQARADDRCGIAAPLQAEFLIIDAARDVGREHQRDVDRFRRSRGLQEEEGAEPERDDGGAYIPEAHRNLRFGLTKVGI